MKYRSMGITLIVVLAAVLQIAQAGITERKGPPPQTEASIAKALANQRTASLLPIDDILNRSAQGGGIDGFNQFVGPGAGGKKTCVTNVGVTQAPQVGSRYGVGSTVAGDQRTVVIKGDIINVCS
jgi:hypothetical protein